MQQQEQKYKVIRIIGKRKYKDNLEYLVQFEFKNQCAWMKLEYLKNHLSFINDYEFAIMSKEVEIQKTLDDFQIDLNLDPNQSIQIDDTDPKDEQTKQDQILPTNIQPQKQSAQKKQNQKQIQQPNSKKQIIQTQEQLQQQEQLKFQLLEKEKEQLEKDQQKKLKEQQLARKPDLEDQDQNVLEVRKIKRYYG